MGDRVKGHALDVGRERLLLTKDFLHVPADRLALAVRVGGEDQRVRLLRLVGYRLELLRAVGRYLPLHREIMLGIDRAVLGRQEAAMAERREHVYAAST